MRRLAFIFLYIVASAFFCFIPAPTAFAYTMRYPVPTHDIEVTSPYGWRLHPIAGEYKYHSGVDFGADYGTIITAAQDGQVVYADNISGYGNSVILTHEQNISTLYAHNQELIVHVGDRVKMGDPIAFAGSTGNSTGPHCHFEVRVDDDPVDPAAYLPGLRSLYQGDASGVPPQDEHGGTIDFDISFDFGEHMRTIINKITETITKALSSINGLLRPLFMMLLVIDFVMAAVRRTTEEQSNEDFQNWSISRLILYGLLLFFWGNWDVVANFAIDSFPAMGAIAIGSTPDEAAAILSDPTQIIQKGMQLITPLINEVLAIKGVLSLINFPVNAIIGLFFTIVFFILFCIIGFQIAKAYIEFYMVILFSFVNFFMSSNKSVRKYASRGLNGVFAASINLMFFAIFAVILQFTMQNIVTEGITVQTNEKEVVASAGMVGEIKSLADCMERIRRVESYGGNYYCDNGVGFYGAYQINKTYWDRWSDDYVANRTETSPSLDTDENYTRWSESGPYDTAPEPTNTKWPWSPHNQDIVAGYILTGYYNRYHSWEAACRAWNQGEGGMENSAAYEYQAKCLNKKASSHNFRTALNYKLLFQLLLLVLVFMKFADYMSNRIITQFGGMGFKLTNEE